MSNPLPSLFPAASKRVAFMVCLAVASFTAGAMWGRSDAPPARVAASALPVVPSAEQAAAMNPRVPDLGDSLDDVPPSF